MKNLLIAAMLLTIGITSCKKQNDLSPNKLMSTDEARAIIGKRIYFNSLVIGLIKIVYNAGDTFVLSAGINYTYFSMANVHDVVFINEGGVVNMQNGFNFNSCTNIKITGTGTKDFYGFEISGHTSGDVGVDINGRSSNITVQ
jgi:hypothetical protein